MPFKINISEKDKTYKIEIEDESLVGKKIGETIKGEEIKSDLANYELIITGTSDKAGFPGMKTQEGPELKRVLLNEGFGLHKKPKGLTKITRKAQKGLRLRKTVRGNTISLNTSQINMKVKTAGSKKLSEIFPKKEEKKEGEEADKTKTQETEQKSEKSEEKKEDN